MMRSFFRRRGVLVLTLALAAMGPAYAALNFTPSAVSPAATSPGAAPFLMPMTIKTNPQVPPNPNIKLPGYGDRIIGVEVGRDDRSPYVAIVVTVDGITGANSNPILAAMGPWWPTFPGGAPGPVPNYPGPAPGDVTLRLVYRPTNDPANPGWVGTAGQGGNPPAPAPGQLDAAWQTCAAIADQLDAFRRQALTPPKMLHSAGPLDVDPWIYLEFDPNGASPSFLECFKLQIVR